MKIKKTNCVLGGAVHSFEFEQNEDANLHHSLSVLSMTQLLLHTFAHLTGPSFRVKAKVLPNNFFLGLV